MKYSLRMKTTGLMLVLALVSAYMLTACSGNGTTVSADSYTGTVSETAQTLDTLVSIDDIKYDEDDVRTQFSSDETKEIKLEGDSIVYSGSKAVTTGSVITIVQSGVFSLSGSLDDGQVIVDTKDKGTVFLILDGVDMKSSDSAPIYIANSDKTVVVLAEGTENVLGDGTDRVFADTEDQEPDSVLFSEDDLTITGSGSLAVNAAYKYGINSKDDLRITGGSITVNSVSDGIRGRDSVEVYDGNITVTAGSDGIQSNNDKDERKGYVAIEGGTIDITCDNDGIQAETALFVSGGNINITAGGGTRNIVVDEAMDEQQKDSQVKVEEPDSTKGLKAGVLLAVSGGDINVDSHDDALHSNDSIGISGGNFVLSTDDDAMHADSKLIIDDGTIDIENCYEGIESKMIVINDGEIRLRSSDDGFNASDGSGSGMMPGMGRTGGFTPGNNTDPSQMNPSDQTDAIGLELHINGGYIYARSNGDGVDSNGSIFMTGGILVVDGPTSNMNGALDSNGQFEIDGGLLVAVGSSGMVDHPDDTSGQYTLVYTYDSVQDAGTMIYIESEDGKQMVAYEPGKEYQSIVFSSPELASGGKYKIYSGGSIDSDESDGLYENGSYTGGTEVEEIELDGILTIAGSQIGQTGGGRGGMFPNGGTIPNQQPGNRQDTRPAP